jgi:hypothetical protein
MRTGAALALTALAALIAAGCGGTDPELAPDDAAGVVQRNVGIDNDATGCLATGFADDPGSAGALDTARPPGQEEREAFVTLFRRCVPIPALTAALALGLSDQVPDPEVPDDGTDPRSCVEDEFGSLDAADQDLLILVFANPSLSDEPGVATATRRLLERCQAATGG